MRLELESKELMDSKDMGLEIGVYGFKGGSADNLNRPAQIYLQVHEGKLQIHIFDGTSKPPYPSTSISIDPLGDSIGSN